MHIRILLYGVVERLLNILLIVFACNMTYSFHYYAIILYSFSCDFAVLVQQVVIVLVSPGLPSPQIQSITLENAHSAFRPNCFQHFPPPPPQGTFEQKFDNCELSVAKC